MDKSEGIKKIAEIMDGANIGALTTISNGKLISRPMGLQQIEFDGDFWFFTYQQSNKIDQIQANPNVNVSFEHKGSWVSVSGVAELSLDKAKQEELWNPVLKAWFPDSLETEGIALMKIHAESAEYWDVNEPRVVQLFGFVKAAVTGEQANPGENRSVDL